VDKKYIRFITEGMKWSGQVAEIIEEFDDTDTSGVEMYSFASSGGYLHFVPSCETQFITEQEYFKERLKGTKVFDDG
jgi:hypothetical protein